MLEVQFYPFLIFKGTSQSQECMKSTERLYFHVMNVSFKLNTSGLWIDTRVESILTSLCVSKHCLISVEHQSDLSVFGGRDRCG